MSKQTIYQKALQIRNETAPEGNTKARIADVLDDINESKPDKNEISELASGKVDKPTNDGNWVLNKLGSVFSWVDASNFGKNVANTLLDTVANAGVNLKANWKIATNAFGFYINGLVDKSNDSTYNQMLVQDANGQVAKSLNSQIMVNGMQAMNDWQKDQFRSAYLKTGEKYSTGQPRVDAVLPALLDISSSSSSSSRLTITGANLFINNVDLVSKVEMIDIETMAIVETIQTIEVHQTMPGIITFLITKNLYTAGKKYGVQVTHNGLKSILNTNAYFMAVNGISNETIGLDWQLTADKANYVENTDYVFAKDDIDSFRLELKTKNTFVGVYSGLALDADKNYLLTFNFIFNITGNVNWNQALIRFWLLPIEEVNKAEVRNYTEMFANFSSWSGVRIFVSNAGKVSEGNNSTGSLTLIISNGMLKVITGAGVWVGALRPSQSGRYVLGMNPDINEKNGQYEILGTVNVVKKAASIFN